MPVSALLQTDPDSGGVGEWLIPPGCKLGALTGYAGSNPAPATIKAGDLEVGDWMLEIGANRLLSNLQLLSRITTPT